MNVFDRLGAAARRRPHADVAVALIVFAVTLLTTAAGGSGARLDATALVLAALACGLLVARRRFPFLVLLGSAVAAEAYRVHYHGEHGEMVLAAPLIALYAVAEGSSRRRALIVGFLAVLTLGGIHILIKPYPSLGAYDLALAALGALAVAAGDASRSRRAYVIEAQARARYAEADREAEAARRVAEERLHIARELHDVVGHRLALIYVQSGVASRVLRDPPEPAREALDHIHAASKAALSELSETIGLLRQPGEQAPPTDPTIGLAGVDDLLAEFRRSGLTISARIEGEVRPIAVAADLTAYRVIQESLTNVRKHAGPTRVEVRLSYQPDLLRVVIDNEAARDVHHESTAPGVIGDHGSGHGLVGMRERVEAVGGTLRAGRRPDGGFRVTTTLLLPDASQP